MSKVFLGIKQLAALAIAMSLVSTMMSFEEISVTNSGSFRIAGVTHIIEKKDLKNLELIRLLNDIDMLILESQSKDSKKDDFVPIRSDNQLPLDIAHQRKLGYICRILSVSETYLNVLSIERKIEVLIDEYLKKSGNYVRLESHLIEFAKRKGIQVHYLQSLPSVPLENEIKILENTIDQIHDSLQNIKRTGQLNQNLSSFLNFSPKPSEPFTHFIISQNWMWLEEISHLDLQYKKLLMLVGSNHLTQVASSGAKRSLEDALLTEDNLVSNISY